ncbi:MULTISPECIES: glycerol-3-phosphate responsive antiterminator [Alteribacter]|uniref:Glycerol uptake operon antiterminator regulatory protein n=1 Tax=Alteribacter keqinensis TaxID=2483800 RepID=A0A3M7TS85_9BACI|nr:MULTISPECIES: glycerol-3-phosphate responsive antiterminator [Alteribacter]MBM7097554.1 glycerol-3-phosphate responsive antiterminator [Alteribacter salitolerans]RNA68518.1 glycerol-3-phosphate responsive antiterminator [Alteribacter keqinensis]
MNDSKQTVLPAIRQLKDFDWLLRSPYETIILLESHIGQLRSIVTTAKRANKKMFIHADLVHGLKSDDYGADFLCQDIKVDGLISTRKNMVLKAKKQGISAIQRLFLLDSLALEASYKKIELTKPDYIEVLPGVVPHLIEEITARTQTPVIAGGLIRTKEDAETALKAGAASVTTSNKELWKHYIEK